MMRAEVTMANEPLVSGNAAGTAGMVGVIMALLACVGVWWVNNKVNDTILGSAAATAEVGSSQAKQIAELAARVDKLEKAGASAPATTASAEPAAAPAAAAPPQ